MRQIAQGIVIVWVIFFIGVVIARRTGQVLQSPILAYDGYLVDVYTAVTYDTSLSNSDSSFQLNIITIVPSPDNTYSMRLDSTNRSYSISVFDADRTLVAQRLEDMNYWYEGGMWIDDTHILARRRVSQFEDRIEFIVLDVRTNQERIAAMTNSVFYNQSPQNNWLLLNPQVAGEVELVNLWDDRRISLSYVASNTFDWSLHDRFFASRTSIAGDTLMQIIDTETGDIIHEDFAPESLRWSPVFNNLLVADETTLRLYRETELLFEESFSDMLIFSVLWASDGNHALARLRTDRNQSSIAIINAHPLINPTVDIIPLPQDTALSSVQFADDATGIIYLTHPADDLTYVYYLSLFDYQITQIAQLKQRIGQVEFITELPSYLARLNE